MEYLYKRYIQKESKDTPLNLRFYDLQGYLNKKSEGKKRFLRKK